jgi:hypothetical protein
VELDEEEPESSLEESGVGTTDDAADDLGMPDGEGPLSSGTRLRDSTRGPLVSTRYLGVEPPGGLVPPGGYDGVSFDMPKTPYSPILLFALDLFKQIRSKKKYPKSRFQGVF